MGLKLSNIQQYKNKMTEYESLDSLILSDSSSEGVIKSPNYNYYNKKREKNQCMYIILYFLLGTSVILLLLLIVCIFIKSI